MAMHHVYDTMGRVVISVNFFPDELWRRGEVRVFGSMVGEVRADPNLSFLFAEYFDTMGKSIGKWESGGVSQLVQNSGLFTGSHPGYVEIREASAVYWVADWHRYLNGELQLVHIGTAVTEWTEEDSFIVSGNVSPGDFNWVKKGIERNQRLLACMAVYAYELGSRFTSQ